LTQAKKNMHILVLVKKARSRIRKKIHYSKIKSDNSIIR